MRFTDLEGIASINNREQHELLSLFRETLDLAIAQESEFPLLPYASLDEYGNTDSLTVRPSLPVALEAERLQHAPDIPQNLPDQKAMEVTLKEVCAFYRIDPENLLIDDRRKDIVLARQMVMHLLRQVTELSFPQIGDFFGKDHTTIMHGVRSLDAKLVQNSALQIQYEFLLEQVRAANERSAEHTIITKQEAFKEKLVVINGDRLASYPVRRLDDQTSRLLDIERDFMLIEGRPEASVRLWRKYGSAALARVRAVEKQRTPKPLPEVIIIRPETP